MSSEVINLPIFNPDILAEMESLQMPGEPDIVAEIFATFLEVAPIRLQTLNELSSKNDLKALSKEAHALKSSSRTIGALRLGDICQKIEHIEQLGLVPQKEAMLAQLKVFLDEVIAEIKVIKPELR